MRSSASGVATTSGTPSAGSVSSGTSARGRRRLGSCDVGLGVGSLRCGGGSAVNVSGCFGSAYPGGTASSPHPRAAGGGPPSYRVIPPTPPGVRRARPRRSSSGVQDARTSTSARGSWSAMPPNDSLATDVTVPLGAVYSAPCASSASISQDQPTRASSGSVTISGSTSARAKVTQRNVPCHASLPAGSCSRTRRPLPISSSPTSTSAVTAAEKGAMRCRGGDVLDGELGPPGLGRERVDRPPELVRGGDGLRVRDHLWSVRARCRRRWMTRRTARCRPAWKDRGVPDATATAPAPPAADGRRAPGAVACWCRPAAGRRARGCPCGSCGRRVVRCPSTARSARASRCSTAAPGPTSSPRSPCSRSGATASTRRSSTPTSWSRSRRPAWTSTSSPAGVRSSPNRSATAPGLDRLVPDRARRPRLRHRGGADCSSPSSARPR